MADPCQNRTARGVIEGYSPFGGIELTIAELDGAAIMAAAGRSAYYWPETEPGAEL